MTPNAMTIPIFNGTSTVMTTIPNNTSTGTFGSITNATFTGASTISTIDANGTAMTVFVDHDSYDQRHIRDRAANGDIKLADFGGLLKLDNGAGKIILPDKSELVFDDYGNYKLKPSKGKNYFQNRYCIKPSQCLLMPDGTMIRMGYNNDYFIEDENAKVTYRGNTQREFNKYVNASELLGDFVGALGSVGVTQDKVLKTPIEYFINWLIHRAAEQDDDKYAAKNVPTLIESKPVLVAKKPRCKSCGCFISNKRDELGINFCNSEHMDKYALKMGA